MKQQIMQQKQHTQLKHNDTHKSKQREYKTHQTITKQSIHAKKQASY